MCFPLAFPYLNRSMSGIELAGLGLGVVGALPITLKALKTSADAVRSFRNASREVRKLHQALETEHVLLRSTCELLLEGLPSGAAIDDLTTEPFSHARKAYSESLSTRLWADHSTFEKEFLAIKEALLEMDEKLGIGKDHEVWKPLAATLLPIGITLTYNPERGRRSRELGRSIEKGGSLCCEKGRLQRLD